MADTGEIADDTSAGSSGDGSEPSHSVEELKNKIEVLEREQQKLHKDFGCQRAKYREIYEKKEEEFNRVSAQKQKLDQELNELKNEMVALKLDRQNVLSEKNKWDAEIASLQRIIQDTLEENSNIQGQCKELKVELAKRGNALEDKERPSDPLPIHKITQATKSFARKMMELGADSSATPAKESLEDEARKAQEDAEALRALLIPLEEQIKNLKQKLRDADDRLQKYEKQECRSFDVGSTEAYFPKSPLQESQVDGANGEPAVFPAPSIPKSVNQEPLIQLSPASPTEPLTAGSVSDAKASPQVAENKDLEAFLGAGDVSTFVSTEEAVSTCEKCREQESLLNATKQQLSEAQKALEMSEKNVQRARDDLNRERTSRQEMESNWNGIKDQYDEQVASLKESLSKCEHSLCGIQEKYLQLVETTERKLAELCQQNVKVREEVEAVQARNDKILGKHYMRSLELQAEDIDLPNTVPELHEMILHQREELIAAKTSAEILEDEAKAFGTELQETREHIEQKEKTLEEYELVLKQLKRREKEYAEISEKQEEREKQLYSEKEELERRLNMEIRIKNKLEKENQDYVQKISSLQKSMTDSEIVQKDFVRLSQDLQKQLEVLRTQDTEVRWQLDDDVDTCPTCKNPFRHSREKIHCRHCGKIFCSGCLKFSVNSGPRRRPNRVCQVCHTLLKPDTAPYFCKEPPSAPD